MIFCGYTHIFEDDTSNGGMLKHVRLAGFPDLHHRVSRFKVSPYFKRFVYNFGSNGHINLICVGTLKFWSMTKQMEAF